MADRQVPAAATASSASGAPSKWSVLGIVAIGVFMCTLDTSIVNVSLPAIARHFGVAVGAQIEWVIIAYLVIIASTLLTIGRFSDRVGRKPIWLAGLCVFTVGSALCGAAQAMWMLIAARVIQGLGGALLMAVSPAMLVSAFPANERGRALGMNAMIVAAGISAGPALGGAITQAASWRWIFYINVPIGIIGVVATLIVLPRERRTEGKRFDARGGVLLGVALGSLAAVLSIGNEVGWTSPIGLALAAAFVVAAILFPLQESRHEAPLIDRSLFRNRLFAWATASLVLSFLSSFAVQFLLPIYFQQLRGFDARRTGLLLTAFPIVIAVVAPVSGRLADRFGSRGLASIGMTILTIGLCLLARLDVGTSTWGVIFPQLVAALGMALFQSPNNSAVMGSAPRDRQGVASGMLATGRTMGQSISIAIAGAVFGTLGGASAGRALVHDRGNAALEATFLHGFRAALFTCAGLSAVAILTSLLRGQDCRA